MKQTKDLKGLIDYLTKNSNVFPKYCDSCGTVYASENTQVIGVRNGLVSCRIHCNNCGSTHIMNVSMPVNGLGIATRSPVNVDLNSIEEFNKFAGKSAVTPDDAIETYKSLNKIKSLNDFKKAVGA